VERISIILELIACMISFGICIAVLNAEFPRRKAISFWSCLLWGILFVCVTYFEIGSNIAASVLGMGNLHWILPSSIFQAHLEQN